ncbi:hypothetical protein [Streptomyces sp. NPDC088864]|uniref:hypothetical protein n=1 Tax=Streptomyces sp. NPDC088864 TaxID=3365910 RepID=UPI00382255F9
MRTRTTAASAAVVLLTLLGSTACTASSDDAPSSRSSQVAETEADQGRAAGNEAPVDPAQCAVPVDKMPEGCEVEVSFAATHEAVPADGMPTPPPGE